MDHQTVAATLNDGEREMLAAGVSEGLWNVREALDQLRLMVVTPSKNFTNRTVLDSLVQHGLARLQGYGEHCTELRDHHGRPRRGQVDRLGAIRPFHSPVRITNHRT